MKHEYTTRLIEVGESGFWSRSFQPKTTQRALDRVLNDMAQEGWRMVGVAPLVSGSPPETKVLLYHFERERS